MLSIWTTVFFVLFRQSSFLTGDVRLGLQGHRVHHPRVWRHTPEQGQPIKIQDSPPTCLTSHPWTKATNQNTGFNTNYFRHCWIVKGIYRTSLSLFDVVLFGSFLPPLSPVSRGNDNDFPHPSLFLFLLSECMVQNHCSMCWINSIFFLSE
jgi:hypothetical protein